MSKRYRMMFGAAAVIAVLAVGGIAAAEQGGNAGGNSADHRQNPTTSTGAAADDSTTTTSTSLPPQAKLHGGQGEVEGQDEAATQDGLCDVALWNASDQGVLHGEAFKRCDGYAARIAAIGTANEHGQGGPSENSHAGGNGGGQGQGADNPHAVNGQSHGKP